MFIGDKQYDVVRDVNRAWAVVLCDKCTYQFGCSLNRSLSLLFHFADSFAVLYFKVGVLFSALFNVYSAIHADFVCVDRYHVQVVVASDDQDLMDLEDTGHHAWSHTVHCIVKARSQLQQIVDPLCE